MGVCLVLVSSHNNTCVKYSFLFHAGFNATAVHTFTCMCEVSRSTWLHQMQLLCQEVKGQRLTVWPLHCWVLRHSNPHTNV